MEVYLSLYITPLVFSAALMAGLSRYAWRRRSAPGAPSLSLITAAVALWSLAYAFEIAAPTLNGKLLWAKIEYAGITILPVAWLMLALQYTRRSNELCWPLIAALAGLPLLSFGLVVSNESHQLIWSATTLVQYGDLQFLSVNHGAWFWVHSVYSYALLLVGTGLIGRDFMLHPPAQQRQLLTLIGAVLAPWLGNMLYLAGLSPLPHLDVTPFSFAFTGVMLTLGLFGFRLLDLIPVARATVFEQMSDGVLIFDMQDCLTDINPAAAALLGCTIREAIGRPCESLLGAGSTEVLCRAQSGDEDTPFSIGDAERRRNLLVRTTQLYSRAQRPIGHLLVLRDITRAQQQERDRQKLTSLIEYSSDFIGMADLNGQIMFLNQAGGALVGLDRSGSAQAVPMYDVIYADDLPLFREQIIPEVMGSGAWSGEIRFQNFRDGLPIPMQFSVFLVRDTQTGAPLAFASVSRDIRERKRAEAHMHAQAALIAEQHQRLQSVISAMRDGIMLINSNRQILVINEAALHMLNLPGDVSAWYDQPITRLIDHFYTQTPAVAEAALAEIYRIDQGDRLPRSGEQTIGATTLRWHSSPIRPGSQQAGRLIVLRDVSEERELERLRDDLTHTMIHDLRNPLTAIKGALDVLADGPSISPDAHDLVDIARRGARRLLNLINSILDLTRLEHGRMPLQQTELQIDMLVGEVLDMLSPLTEMKQIRVQRSLTGLSPIWADAGLIGRVFQNLIGNAIKFTPEQGAVTISAGSAEAYPEMLRITVYNSGDGVPPELQGRLFQKFVTGANREGGSGLGLAFCKLAIEAHGGQIWLERAVSGAAFTLTLPLQACLDGESVVVAPAPDAPLAQPL